MATISLSSEGSAGDSDVSNAARLAHSLALLRGCREPAELIYRKEGPPLFFNAHPSTTETDYSVVVARRIAILVGRLSALSDPKMGAERTPRVILTALMEVVREALIMAMSSNPPQEITADAFCTVISSRAVRVEAMVEGLHHLTYASTKLRVELVTLQLQKRITEERQTAATTATPSIPTTEQHLAALVVTETLLEDFISIYDNILLILPAGQLALSSEREAAVVLPSLMRYYYQLGDWVLHTGSLSDVPPLALTHITRLVWDEKKGAVEVDLRRSSLDAAWGLLLNEKGRLIDVDVAMRVHDRARRFHELLKSTRDDAVVVAVNGVAIPAAAGEYPRRVLQALRDASTSRRTLRLVVRAKSLRRAPVEVLFRSHDPGGEGASGQRAVLLFHRISPSAAWNFHINEDLRWHPPPLSLLPEAAKAFVRQYPRRLRLRSVNGVEVRSVAQVASLTTQETVLLELVVTPPDSPPPKEAAGLKGRRSHPEDLPEPRALLEALKPKPSSRRPKEAPQTEGTDTAPMDVPLLQGVSHQDKAQLVEKAKGNKGGKAGARNISPKDIANTAQVAVDGSNEGRRAEKKVVESTLENIRQRPTRAPFDIDTNIINNGNTPGVRDVPTSKMEEVSGKVAIEDTSTTPPCRFDHGVEMISFINGEMVLRRPSVENAWGIKIVLDEHSNSITALPMRLLALPDVSKPSDAHHPFIKRFTTPPSDWFLVSINGKSLKGQGPTAMLSYMKSLTTMQLKLLRKLIKK
ncbi:unnamed protein product [Phytomonas sp. Hart1]|nr:unnamed protein product [Phytomonas sp. Hart1]|eukprot:CCW71596.1 unnamed protein product [Phytomonas sp. isolate Hart1]